ncbi:Carbonic anhydrase or acetyltransferase, isoleucine patch superfamily [Desulfuromusa kysingii]|uniref:Carbonic anhydrase or acetyltransferase, isoleucine patch superfamily n=1 Tax=Desulfuromusa kysingii TaxID=37625 RepID=A0A1H4BP59_9BACT|nr:gamma carbonic anhydrase family protein [Desulfuromusa kysingii]SEA49878.1 Carbonic anhydrase or acetyltransferase, isoleucine patch superfamily [Desulfuromusa kysingii]
MLHKYQGLSPKLDPTVFCAASAEIIGDVVIGVDSSVWFQVVIRGDVNSIHIGDRSNIQDGTVIHVTHDIYPTIIGDDVTVGHNVILHGCKIGNRCLIGMGAIVLDGAEVADDAMVAAGALVTPGTSIPSGTLYAGAPARFKRHLSEKEVDDLKQSAKHYVHYAENYKC